MMPKYVARRVDDLLGRYGKGLNGSSVLILGIAYKRDVTDIRESPALALISSLLAEGAQVCYPDPLVPSLVYHQRQWTSRPIYAATLNKQDCVIIVTDHSCVDYQYVVDNSNLIFDARNATQHVRSGCD